MSETLEERLRRDARDECVVRAHVYARDVIELLDARDKTITEQCAVIAELSEEPITEFETLRQAHDAQNEVLRRMQAELDSTRAWFADIQRDFDKELATLRAENATLREACTGLVNYRQRAGPLNFQLEKADYYLRKIAQMLGKVIQ